MSTVMALICSGGLFSLLLGSRGEVGQVDAREGLTGGGTGKAGEEGQDDMSQYLMALIILPSNEGVEAREEGVIARGLGDCMSGVGE